MQRQIKAFACRRFQIKTDLFPANIHAALIPKGRVEQI